MKPAGLDMGKLLNQYGYSGDGGLVLLRNLKNGHKIGRVIYGAVHHSGYLVAGFDGRQCLMQRLVFAVCKKIDPANLQIDHKDRCKTNNRIENLRLATASQNGMNVVEGIGRSGFRGVALNSQYPLRSSKPFKASIRKENGFYRHLGYFDTAQDAHAAYLAARAEHFGDFA